MEGADESTEHPYFNILPQSLAQICSILPRRIHFHSEIRQLSIESSACMDDTFDTWMTMMIHWMPPISPARQDINR